MMHILALSDLHGYLPEIPPCDLLLLGGDYCASPNTEQQIRHLRGPFSDWLRELDTRYVLGIAGNHDFALRDSKHLLGDIPWTYLEDEMIDLEGIKIYGTPWTPKFGYWAFMKEDKYLRDKFNNIPDGLDILLSHGPVRGILDKEKFGEHCGSRELLYKVKSAKPNSFVSGHIHEAHGVYDEGPTRFYNVAHVNRDLEPVHAPIHIPLVI